MKSIVKILTAILLTVLILDGHSNIPTNSNEEISTKIFNYSSIPLENLFQKHWTELVTLDAKAGYDNYKRARYEGHIINRSQKTITSIEISSTNLPLDFKISEYDPYFKPDKYIASNLVSNVTIKPNQKYYFSFNTGERTNYWISWVRYSDGTYDQIRGLPSFYYQGVKIKVIKK